MRIYPGTTVDSEFASLGTAGFTGSLNDRQFAFLRNAGRSGSLTDMMYQHAAVNLGDAVEAALSGTAGFAFDPSDETTLFQDTAASVPVTVASDPVGRMNGFWGSAAPNFQQGTAGSRPAWDGTGIAYDGIDDHFPTFSNLAFLNNVPGAFYCERNQFSSLAVTQTIIGFSTVTVGNARFVLAVTTGGALTLSLRRLDADGVSTITSAGSLVTAGVPYVISAEADFAGTGLGRIWLNGSLVASGAISGVAGNTTNVNSGRFRKGAALSGSVFATGWTRRGVMSPFVMSDANRASIEAWVGGI